MTLHCLQRMMDLAPQLAAATAASSLQPLRNSETDLVIASAVCGAAGRMLVSLGRHHVASRCLGPGRCLVPKGVGSVEEVRSGQERHKLTALCHGSMAQRTSSALFQWRLTQV
jgi:hypothetical protein